MFNHDGQRSSDPQTQNLGKLNFLSIPHWIRMNQDNVSGSGVYRKPMIPHLLNAILDEIFCSLQLKVFT